MRALLSLLLLTGCPSVVDVVAEGEGEGEGEGEPQCRGDEPTDVDVDDCDTIAAASCADESAKAACRDAGLVLRTGLFDAAYDCLSAISACASLADEVNACFAALTACPHPEGDNLCNLADQACRDVNDDNFTLDTCLADFRAINQAFLDAWLECFNANPTVPCGDIHEFCYNQAFASLVQ